MIPFFMVLGGFTLSRLHETFAGVNGKVQLAKMLSEPTDNGIKPEPFELTAFKSSGKPVREVYEEASVIISDFYTGSWVLGCFLGLAFGFTLAGRLLPKYRTDYVPNRGTCFSCARCVDYCPVDREENSLKI
jgi:ferredoxin